MWRTSFPEYDDVEVGLEPGVKLVGGEAGPHADLVRVVAAIEPAVEAVPPRLCRVHRVLVHTPQHTFKEELIPLTGTLSQADIYFMFLGTLQID